MVVRSVSWLRMCCDGVEECSGSGGDGINCIMMVSNVLVIVLLGYWCCGNGGASGKK